MIPTRGRRCPDCRQPTLITRTEEEADPYGLLRKSYLECRNLLCGSTFGGIREITYRISPPRVPNPNVDLPYISKPELRKARIKFFSKDEQQNELDLEE